MKNTIEEHITRCYHYCPFFRSGNDGMECVHPFFADKEPYDNLIITQENSKDGNIPEKCPLRKHNLTLVYKLILK